MSKNVHNSIIRENKILEKTQMSINSKTDYKNIWYSQLNSISSKVEWTTAMCTDMNESQKNNHEQKKVHTVWFHLRKVQNQSKASDMLLWNLPHVLKL